MARQLPAPITHPTQGLFLTIGVRAGEAGRRDLERAEQILKRNGFRVGVTSEEAVLAMADVLRPPPKPPSAGEALRSALSLAHVHLELAGGIRNRIGARALDRLVKKYDHGGSAK